MAKVNGKGLVPHRRLGLIVNPVAGIGGRVGLKGSDGLEIQRRALALGAVPTATDRTVEALKGLSTVDGLELITYPGEMGADAAWTCGLTPTIIGAIQAGRTTAEDTQRAARDMRQLQVDLLLFAGGDGTARDIYNAVGTGLPVLGTPAGVKIHSAVYATSPRTAGELAALYLQGRVSRLREAEVMDIDEEAFRQGVVSARLYGYLKIPFRSQLVQGVKVASRPSAQAVLRSIARAVINQMEDDCLYIIGPGTTTRAVTSELGLNKTLIGVDVIMGRKLIASDVNEAQLLELTRGQRAKIIVTPIGGQGYLFGRGNQQISPHVIQAVDPHNVIVISTPEKLHALRGRPLLVDTGDGAVDRLLSGYIRVVTGYDEATVYRVSQ